MASVRMNPMGNELFGMRAAKGTRRLVSRQSGSWKRKGGDMTRTTLRRLAAVFAMVVGFAFAASAAPASADTTSPSAVSSAGFGGTYSALGDWWW